MAIGETKLLIINEHIKLCRAKKLEMEVSPRTKQHCQTRGILEGHQHPLGGTTDMDGLIFPRRRLLLVAGILTSVA